MRITQVTTRVGDQGNTRLVGGQEVPKFHPRVEAYGTVDELNAALGVARAAVGGEQPAAARIDGVLNRVQNHLLRLGGFLATLPADRWEGMVSVGDAEIGFLEQVIGLLNEDLPGLQEFVLPGGGPVSAALHLARTVCRRAERRVVGLVQTGEEPSLDVVRYLNRLSDLLFVLARWAAKSLGERERMWDRTLDP